MLPILSAAQIRAADQYTIAHEPIASIDLMERAAVAFCKWFSEKFPATHKSIYIFCGKGNNGGDGLAVSRILLKQDYEIKTFIVASEAMPSNDFSINLERLSATANSKILYIEKPEDFPAIEKEAVVVDALFGSGLNKPLEGVFKELIEHLNLCHCHKIAIDIPSGLLSDQHAEGTIFKAHHTFSFELPKYALLLPENYAYVGDFHFDSIGLNSHFISEQITDKYYLTFNDITTRFRKRKKFEHKGSYGHALLIAGSYGKTGAAILAAKAALHSGCGLATIYTSSCGYNAILASLPQAMLLCDEKENFISEIPETNSYNAIGIGPGIGTHKKTVATLFQFLEKQNSPLVLDADALNIIAADKKYLHLIPKNSIITPHPKEFERLFGKSENDFEHHNLQVQQAKALGIIIVLKGANTAIAMPDGNTYFNATGNPGMATAGSGDVLTGIITSFLAQGYSPEDAAIMGVYIHGMAGDVAAKNKSQTFITALEIIDSLSSVFMSVEEKIV